jgi:CRP-like cAMP-binding protein
VFKKNERFSDSMIKMLSSNLDDSFGKMADLAYKPVRGRMAEALLFLNAFYKDEKNKNGIITMTREDLASFVGTVKETAIRILKEFKDEGLIETDKSDIIIKNTDGLIRISKLYD